jgi:MPBQ/MSBQ methyltransferase
MVTDQNQVGKRVQGHYAKKELGDQLLAALTAAGKDLGNLHPADLAPVDEFHIRGRAATIELAHAAGLRAGMNVLDVGSGIGGPSRSIAAEFGCRVHGIDLTEEYCSVAEMLTNMVGLSHLVSFRQGDALHLPYAEASFDVVWTQHTAMNIQDKGELYREIYRVLKPGGSVALYDILAGPVAPVHFPVPWSHGPDTSFLVTPDELRRLLEAAGFVIAVWQDTTEAARSWFRSVSGRGGTRPLGLHTLMGEDFHAMTGNQMRNLDENRIMLFQVTARKQPLPGAGSYRDSAS